MSDNNFLQDVVPPTRKRSIRNIPLPKHRQKEEEFISEEMEIPESESIQEIMAPKKRSTPPSPPISTPKRIRQDVESPKPPRKKLFIGIIVGVILLFLIIVNAFSSASVSITPRTEAISVESTNIPIFEGEYDPTVKSLTYTKSEVSKELSEKLKASGEEEVEIKASGRITIYNNYSDKDQPLVKQTRFESSDGKIYRIQDSITVPGQKTEGGKTVPGSIDVEVFADEAGDEYNIESSDFTVPGFKNLPQFDGFYAKSKTEMSGGFKGVKKVVNESDRQNAERALSEQLRKDLVAMLENNSLTEGKVVVYQDSDFLFESKEEQGDGDTVNFKTKGTLSIKLVDVKYLANILSGIFIPTFNSSNDVTIKNPSDLSYSIQDEKLTISGNTKIEWVIDQDLLKEQLSGKSKSEISTVFKEFDGINEASIDLKPFWKRDFPEDFDSIKISIGDNID